MFSPSMINNNGSERKPRPQTGRPTLRYSPELAAEIGDLETLLLLQLDYWLATEGRPRPRVRTKAVRRASRAPLPRPCVRRPRWLKLSAADIQARAFPHWSVRKIQRILKRLADRDLIHAAAFDAPRNPTPYITLSPSFISKYIFLSISHLITYVTPTSADAPPDQPPQPPTRVKNVATPRQICRDPASKTSRPRVKNVAPYLLYKKLDQDSKEEEQERENNDPDHKSDRNGHTPPKPPLSNPDQSLIEKIAEVTKLDPRLNADALQQTADALQKGGYTLADLIDFAAWWDTEDYRGKKHSPPYPKQILENIRKALDSPTTRKRRALAAGNYDPRTW